MLLRRLSTSCIRSNIINSRILTSSLSHQLRSSSSSSSLLISSRCCIPSHTTSFRQMSASSSSSSSSSSSDTIQHYPALLPESSRHPSTFSFGRIQLPASSIFFVSRYSYVSVNLSPILPGHVLVMPRSNMPRVKQLAPHELTDLWLTAQHVARVLEARMKAASITFAIQDGVEAGQKIPCVHIHIIPRQAKDLVKNDDIYDMIEKNVPAQMMAVEGKEKNTTVEAPKAVSHAIHPDGPSSDTKPTTVKESLDDGKRVFRSRAEQAVEAREFASWMQEAGVPEYFTSSQISLLPTTNTKLPPVVQDPKQYHPNFELSQGEETYPSYISLNDHGQPCLRASVELPDKTLVATANFSPASMEAAKSKSGYGEVRGRYAFCTHSSDPNCSIVSVPPAQPITDPTSKFIPIVHVLTKRSVRAHEELTTAPLTAENAKL